VNRRSFLSSFIKGAALWTAAPQIITHGLGLVKARLEPVFRYDPFLYAGPWTIKEWPPGLGDVIRIPRYTLNEAKAQFERLAIDWNELEPSESWKTP
jgi:hypothetical protein